MGSLDEGKETLKKPLTFLQSVPKFFSKSENTFCACLIPQGKFFFFGPTLLTDRFVNIIIALLRGPNLILKFDLQKDTLAMLL